jgi:DNA/RNA-binding domain of Phe-tRNA-synthetase-like protein
MPLLVEPHPLLRVAAFTTRFHAPLGSVDAAALIPLLRADAPAPLQRDEVVRAAVRDMLRHGGYKPTGRGKPASEYLVRAAEEGTLSPINAAVDVCNVVSLHSGLPISVIDSARAREPYRIAIAGDNDKYVFNQSGQEIDVGGLVCLFDADGPCANAVKDAQRTKTNDETRGTLSIVWGVAGHDERVEAAVRWYRALLQDLGAATDVVELTA